MKNNEVYLKHIIEAIEKIARYINEENLESFKKNDLVLDAVTRELEIIGEAACNISQDFQEKYSNVPWGKMIGMRNRLIHEYFGTDRDIIWETCQTDLKELKGLIIKLLG